MVAAVTVSPTGRSIAPSTMFVIGAPSRISISTSEEPSAKVVTLAPAKGARSIKNTRKNGVLLRGVSFGMVSPTLSGGFIHIKLRRSPVIAF